LITFMYFSQNNTATIILYYNHKSYTITHSHTPSHTKTKNPKIPTSRHQKNTKLPPTITNKNPQLHI
jgi:hypothetical protein